MKLLSLLLASLILFSSLEARPPGKGPAQGGSDFRGVIHSLFANYEDFERKVEILENGYRAVTTSKDPKSAKLLQEHVIQMKERLDGGFGVRHWDPAFAELREHHEDMTIELEEITGGVSVSVMGKTPEAIQVAKNHAKIVSGFVEKGGEQMHATHPAVVSGKEGESTELAKAACSCGGEKGQGKGKKQTATEGESAVPAKPAKAACPCEGKGKGQGKGKGKKQSGKGQGHAKKEGASAGKASCGESCKGSCKGGCEGACKKSPSEKDSTPETKE